MRGAYRNHVIHLTGGSADESGGFSGSIFTRVYDKYSYPLAFTPRLSVSLSRYQPFGTGITSGIRRRPRIAVRSGSGRRRLREGLYRCPIGCPIAFSVFFAYLTRYSASRRYCPVSSSGVTRIYPYDQAFWISLAEVVPERTMWMWEAPRSPTSAVHMYLSSDPFLRQIRRKRSSRVFTCRRMATSPCGLASFR